MVKQIKGDLIKSAKKGEFDVICHGCNIFCTMGSGIAKSIRDEWPEAYDVDCATIMGDASKLGTITFTMNVPNLTIVNCYTQGEYGRDTKVYADYDAIEKSMIEIKSQFLGKRIGMPLIGAGLARGDWSIILPIIEKVFCDPTDDVTIVEWEQNTPIQKKNSNSSSIVSSLSAFSSLGQSSVSSNNSTQIIIKKKFHGKRKCKVCNTYHPIKELNNYLPSTWVCKQKCNDDFIKKVIEINNLTTLN